MATRAVDTEDGAVRSGVLAGFLPPVDEMFNE